MDDSTFRYELRVPAAANAGEGWPKPAHSGEMTTWAGTAHDLGRLVLQRWHETAAEKYQGLPAFVEVHSDDGRHALIEDSTPVHGPTLALECAIEDAQVADFAHDVKRQELAEAMQDARKFDGLSARNIEHRVRFVLAAEEAQKILGDGQE
ncbi:hypothetical protein G6W61_10355 [Streptomyces sp. KAI-26]|uniref:hypothetical protein n=1 Tax=Streptomyces sp. KAI-26 TaxID=1169747 RepID=UPI00158700AD|nr:hypothetical protein [Streptomyces sp. KAI-26]NUV86607.1 hypothetical protein [Streptomyces sp. KAI-26]NUW21198.1 hypothetical protein [Streptomyces roseoviolaceus]